MSEKVYSAAKAYCRFPEGTTMEEAWNLISGAFTGKEGTDAKNFLNASDIQRTGFKSDRHAVAAGDIFEYQSIGSAGTRTGHVEITDWVPGQSLAYNEIHASAPNVDLRDSKTASNRMEFELEESEGRIILSIDRRNKGDISFPQSLSTKFKNSAMDNLVYHLSPSAITPIGKKAVSVKTQHFDSTLVERNDDNRLEF